MSNPGNRKQRYILDIDDVVKDGFMTKANAEALIRGINGSGGVVKLGVPFGGTNNAAFTDQELLKYDALTNKIVSSGVTGVLPGGQSVFIPWETQVQYADQSVDSTSKSVSEMEIGTFSFPLGANAVWSDLLLVFQFALNAANPSMTGLRILLNDEVIEPSTILCPQKTLLYQVEPASDTMVHTWVAMGSIPPSQNFNDPLVVHLLGVPQDLPNFRKCMVRLSSRHLVPSPAGGGQKGIPVFLTPDYLVYSGVGSTGWTTVDISSRVPEGASAVLINTFARSNEQGGGSRNVKYRTQAGGGEYLLVSCQTNNDEDDIDTDTTQMILPFKSSGGVRSFQYLVEAFFNGGVNIVLTGYIT